MMNELFFARGGDGSGGRDRPVTEEREFEPGEGCYSRISCQDFGYCAESHTIENEIRNLETGLALEDPSTLKYQIGKSQCLLAEEARRRAREYLDSIRSR